MQENILGCEIYLHELKTCLTVRAINVCAQVGLLTVNKILDYYNNYGSFLKIRNCGELTNEQLCKFCVEYSRHNNIVLRATPSIEEEKSNLQNLLVNSNRLQRQLIELQIRNDLSTLSSRTLNVIEKTTGGGGFDQIIDFLAKGRQYYAKMRNIGEKSLLELNHLHQKLLECWVSASGLSEYDLTQKYIRAFVYWKFPKAKITAVEIPYHTILDDNNRLKVFSFLNFLVSKDLIFSPIEKIFFEQSYVKGSGLSYIPLKEIAAKYAYSTERIRQLKNKFYQSVERDFSFIWFFPADKIKAYEVPMYSDLYLISDLLINSINANEDTSFSKKTFATVFKMLLSNRQDASADLRTILGVAKTKNSYDFQNCYLIPSTLENLFDFNTFIGEIGKRKSDKRKNGYTVNLNELLEKYFKTTNLNDIEKHKILETAKLLLEKELDIAIGDNNLIVLKKPDRGQRKKQKSSLIDTCYSLLETNGHPMTLVEIKKLLAEIYECYPLTESLRATLVKQKEKFIAFGRTSTYGLKIWEQSGEVKGGPIRKIVYDFLCATDSPQHIKTITDYVCKFRPKTYTASILSNLKVETQDKFIWFKGGYIGVKGKDYQNLVNFYRISNSRFTKTTLKKYENLHINKVVEILSQKYGYELIQVQYVLEKKIKENSIQLSDDQLLRVL